MENTTTPDTGVVPVENTRNVVFIQPKPIASAAGPSSTRAVNQGEVSQPVAKKPRVSCSKCTSTFISERTLATHFQKFHQLRSNAKILHGKAKAGGTSKKVHQTEENAAANMTDEMERDADIYFLFQASITPFRDYRSMPTYARIKHLFEGASINCEDSSRQSKSSEYIWTYDCVTTKDFVQQKC